MKIREKKFLSALGGLEKYKDPIYTVERENLYADLH